MVEWAPPTHLGYVVRKGLPVRGYRADIVLGEVRRDEGSGTAITWSGSFDPLVPGTGALVVAYIRGLIRLFVRELVRYADRLDGEAPAGDAPP